MSFECIPAVGYGRVSTKKQSKQSGNGLATQRRYTTSLAAQNGLHVTDWIFEVASSMQSTGCKRPGLWEAVEMAYLSDKPLVVYDITRIGRDLDLIAGIIGLGVVVYDASRGRILTLEEALAITEESRRSFIESHEGLRRSIERRRKAGIPLGNAGICEIRKKGTTANALKARKHRDRIREHVKEVLRSMLADGIQKMNWQSFSHRLNAAGIVTRGRKRLWSRITAKKMLQKLRADH